MDRIAIGFDEAQRTASEVIAEYGAEYRYEQVAIEGDDPACVYVDAGAPSCLVGHILHRLGVPLGRLEDNNNTGVGDRRFLTEVGVQADDRVAYFLEQIQEEQDSGLPWGLALQVAIERGEDRELPDPA